MIHVNSIYNGEVEIHMEKRVKKHLCRKFIHLNFANSKSGTYLFFCLEASGVKCKGVTLKSNY